MQVCMYLRWGNPRQKYVSLNDMVKIKIAGGLKGFIFHQVSPQEELFIRPIICMTDFFAAFLSRRGRRGGGDSWQVNLNVVGNNRWLWCVPWSCWLPLRGFPVLSAVVLARRFPIDPPELNGEMLCNKLMARSGLRTQWQMWKKLKKIGRKPEYGFIPVRVLVRKVLQDAEVVAYAAGARLFVNQHGKFGQLINPPTPSESTKGICWMPDLYSLIKPEITCTDCLQCWASFQKLEMLLWFGSWIKGLQKYEVKTL